MLLLKDTITLTNLLVDKSFTQHFQYKINLDLILGVKKENVDNLPLLFCDGITLEGLETTHLLLLKHTGPESLLLIK